MKKLGRILVLAVVAVLCVAMLAACGKKGEAIQKAFEKEGWTVKVTDVAELSKSLSFSEDVQKDLEGCKIYTVTKGLLDGLVFVVEFPTDKELKDDCKELVKESYEDAKEAGIVNGNCLLICLSLNKDAVNIFKNA